MEAIGMIVIGLLLIELGGFLTGIGLTALNVEFGERVAKYSTLLILSIVITGVFVAAYFAFGKAVSLLF